MTRMLAGSPLSDEPRDWTPAQIEAMLPAAIGKGDMRFVEAALKLLAVKDPHRAQEVVDTLKVGVMLAKERDA